MVRLMISPRSEENLYGLHVQKELALGKKSQGTLHRYGPKKKDEEKWGHTPKKGWIRFQRCLGQIVVTTIQARDEAEVGKDPFLRPIFQDKSLRCATEEFAAFLIQFLGGDE